MIKIPENDKNLIVDFVSTLNSMKKSYKERNVDTAKTSYQQLLLLYNQIQASSLDEVHKEIAYDQTMEAYRRLEQLKEGNIPGNVPEGKNVPRSLVFSGVNIVAAAVIIVVLSFVIFLKPSIIGLPFLEERIVQNVDLTFSENSFQSIAFREPPTSFRVSGIFQGAGAKLYLAEGEKRFLVFDSSKSKVAADSTFRGACIETCSLSGVSSNQLRLEAETDGTIKISEIAYTTNAIGNNPPFWNSKEDKFVISGNKEIDLSNYFLDQDLDELTFLATKPNGIQVVISGSIINLTPESGFKGESEVTFVASDGKDTAKHAVKLVVE